jgi:hypothetical protein
VLPAEAAVLAQRDSIWIVALALVGLVVAALALLAREGYSDSNISAGHASPLRELMMGAWTKKNPAQARG